MIQIKKSLNHFIIPIKEGIMYMTHADDKVERRDRPILFVRGRSGEGNQIEIKKGALVSCGIGRLKLEKLAGFGGAVGQKPLLVERPDLLNK